MNIIKPSIRIKQIDGAELIRNIEEYGRTCYQSADRMTTESAIPFIKNAIKLGHFSIIEHEKITATVVVDRGVSHEIVRHRIASYSQESTRYVNYKDGIEVIDPIFWPEDSTSDDIQMCKSIWESAMISAEESYRKMLGLGATPEQARGVLPTSVATELVMTYNLREWRHFFWLRGSRGAHPQIREIAVMLLVALKNLVPAVFDDFDIDPIKNIISTKVLPAS
jgi:thymidylate synthase (FAD)